MANYIFSYDLNGQHPTHAEMDDHLNESGWSVGRILETVWYIGTSLDIADVAEYVRGILSENDRHIVVGAELATFENLLVTDESLLAAWRAHE